MVPGRSSVMLMRPTMMTVRSTMVMRMILAEHVRFQMRAQLVAEGAEFGNLFFSEASSEFCVLLMEACFDTLDSIFAAFAE